MSVTGMPKVILLVNGVALDSQTLAGLSGVNVAQRLSLPTQCELTFTLPAKNQVDALTARLPTGTAIQIRVGVQPQPLFTGEISAHEYVYGPTGERTLYVRAYDLLYRLRQRQPVRVHVDITPAGLAQELVAELGLRVEAVHPGPLWHHLIQHDRSDLQLLSDIAADAGLYLTVRENILHLLTLAGTGDPIPLELGRGLQEATVNLQPAAAPRGVAVAGWNPLEVEAHRADAGGGDSHHQVGRTLADNRHAELRAQAELDRQTAASTSLWGIAAGDTRLCPGTPIRVTGLDAAANGRYVLTGVTHNLGTWEGYVAELFTEPPAPPAAPVLRESATFGVVTQVSDPRQVGRVRVRLPAFADVETDWMQVLLLGAGEGKGLMIVPAVGDRVLVLLPRGDAGEGIVLGGLVGLTGAADSGVEGNLVRRFTLQTPGGQRVRLDDAGNILRLENSSGSYVELSPSHVRLYAAQDLTVEAPGKQIVIRGNTIDFERG